MGDSACPGCGIVLPEASGPTHPYIAASPACWSSYSELLAIQYSSPERAAFHQVVVDAYAVSHPDPSLTSPDPRAVRSVGIHLMTLCMFLEQGTDPAHGTRLHHRMVQRPVFEPLSAPALEGRLTHLHVPREGSVTRARQASFEWAESAWQAWSPAHDKVRSWLAQAGLRNRV